MLHNKDEIIICSYHEKQIPVIRTYVFPGAEWWCPACGSLKSHLFNPFNWVELTDELEKSLEEWKEKSYDYLGVRGALNCNSFYFEGKRIKLSELPQEAKDRYQKIISEWKYEIKL